MRFSIGEKSLPYFFEAARKKFPFFLRRLEKVSILFEAARKKFPFFLRRLEKSFQEQEALKKEFLSRLIDDKTPYKVPLETL